MSAMEDKLTAKEIIAAICQNMMESVEEFPQEILVPSVYDVYLSLEDFTRLERLVEKIEDAAKQELDKKLEELNDSAKRNRSLTRWLPFRQKEPVYVVAQPDWEIRIQQDPNNQVKKNHAEIWSSFLSGAREDSVTSTKRVVKFKDGETHKVKELRRETQPVYAVITYQDSGGKHVFSVTKKETIIGRGGASVWVDLKLRVAGDVSRRHAIIRYDETNGKFSIKHIGRFETTVNGVEVPQASDDGQFPPPLMRELPKQARIELAKKVTLHFEAKKTK